MTVIFYSNFSEIKTSIASSPNQAEDKLSEQAPSPYLVPALVVSVLLNLLTGGAIINNYIAPTERTDDAGAGEPLQASSFSINPSPPLSLSLFLPGNNYSLLELD